jgi:hypothetical protein
MSPLKIKIPGKKSQQTALCAEGFNSGLKGIMPLANLNNFITYIFSLLV